MAIITGIGKRDKTFFEKSLIFLLYSIADTVKGPVNHRQ